MPICGYQATELDSWSMHVCNYQVNSNGALVYAYLWLPGYRSMHVCNYQVKSNGELVYFSAVTTLHELES